jgi:vitamin B12 transporter
MTLSLGRTLTFLLVLACLLAGQGSNFVQGRVFDKETGDPLPAFISVSGTELGATAGRDGRFKISLGSAFPAPGQKFKLIIWLIGYKRCEVDARPGQDLAIGLELEPLAAHEVTVSADSSVTEDRSQRTVTLDKMDTYQLPGTAADPLYAAHVLPGVNSLPDSSSMLIRGGAPDEVAYVFDGIEIAHPFLSQSLHEGYFSIFDNQIIEDFSVSTSGFSTAYGDALSGLMDITAKDTLFRGEGGLGLSVLGLNSYLGLPLRNSGTFVGSFNLSRSELMTELNGRHDRSFGTQNAFAKLTLRLGAGHTLRLLGLYDDYTYQETGGFRAFSHNGVAGMSLTSTLSRNFIARFTLSGTFYRASYRFQDVFRQDYQDDTEQARVEASLDLERHFLEAGADLRWKRLAGDWQSWTSGSQSVNGIRRTFFLNDKFRLRDNLYVTAGLRFSSLSLGRPGWGLEPRLSLVYFLGKNDTLRFSTGLYRQFGDYFVLEQQAGLKPKTSFQLCLSYDRSTENTNIRLTVYNKEYHDLFLNSPDSGRLANSGRGFARGAEFFIKTEGQRLEALLVYNFLSSQRQENEVLILARSPYDITHSLTAIVTVKGKHSSLGLRYSYASGLPTTPLLGREWDEESGAYLPLWGEPYSQRCPPYRRCDLNGTWTLTLWKQMVVLYFGITNLFNDQNILRYEYNEDYSLRQNSASIFGRTVFVGLYVPFF